MTIKKKRSLKIVGICIQSQMYNAECRLHSSFMCSIRMKYDARRVSLLLYALREK